MAGAGSVCSPFPGGNCFLHSPQYLWVPSHIWEPLRIPYLSGLLASIPSAFVRPTLLPCLSHGDNSGLHVPYEVVSLMTVPHPFSACQRSHPLATACTGSNSASAPAETIQRTSHALLRAFPAAEAAPPRHSQHKTKTERLTN
eukprot:358070-Chlamydomonas_euryale.AAC.1